MHNISIIEDIKSLYQRAKIKKEAAFIDVYAAALAHISHAARYGRTTIIIDVRNYQNICDSHYIAFSNTELTALMKEALEADGFCVRYTENVYHENLEVSGWEELQRESST